MPQEMKKCLVLLGTYNGEKYLREQIDSILAQQDVEVYIKASDDCSTDGTALILEEYKTNFPNFDYSVNKENKNFTYNFLDLFFSEATDEYDYFAFSDQDDFWLPDKLINAINKIELCDNEKQKGVLYCSNLIVADENLNKLGMQEDESIYKCNKNNFIFENIATGCTIVFDKTFKNQALKYYPVNIRLHDYWLFLIAAYTADYIYDFDGYILYRQHSSNQIGSNKKKWTWSNFKKFFKYKGDQSKLAEQLLIGYESEITDEQDLENIRLVRDYKRKFGSKLKLLFKKRFKKRKNNLILKIKILFNKL